MMVLSWVVFAVLLIGQFAGIIWAVVFDMDKLTVANSRLPQDTQFPLIGRSPTWELWNQYKILFPEGTLLCRSRWCFAAACLCLGNRHILRVPLISSQVK
jgi:hypothetical protein